MKKLLMTSKQRADKIREYESKIEELEKEQKYLMNDSLKYLQAKDGIEYYNELINEIYKDINKQYR